MNDIYHLSGLWQLKQFEEETMDSFYARVSEQVGFLNLAEKKPEEFSQLLILSQMVQNSSIPALHKKAIWDGLNQDKILKEARTLEQTEFQIKKMNEVQSGTADYAVAAVRSNHRVACHSQEAKPCGKCG